MALSDLLSTSVPSGLPPPLVPTRIKISAVDLLTGLELAPRLPKTELLMPCKYLALPAIEYPIEREDVERKVTLKDAEEFYGFLFPNLDILSDEEPEPIQDEIPSVTVNEIKPKKKRKKRKKKKKSIETIEPIVAIPPQQPKQLQASMMPRRNNLSKAGELGTKTQIFVNMLAIEFGDYLPNQIEQYHVYYDPCKPNFLTYKAYLAVKSQLFPEYNPAYSKGVILSAGCLPIDPPLQLTVKVKEYDDSEEIDVRVAIIKIVKKDDRALDLNWMRNIQESSPKEKKNIASVSALQIIMNSVAMNQSIKAKGSYFIPPLDGPTYLDGGLEIRYGLFQSVTVGWRPFLKVDVVHKSFLWNITVIDYVKSIIIIQESEDLCFDDFESKWNFINERLIHLRVTISCNNERRRKQMILHLVNKRPHELIYESDEMNEEMISVRDYFLKEKNYEIQYPDLPCLLIANQEKYEYVPMELCTIEGERSLKCSMLSDSQQEKIHKVAVTNANKRRQKIHHVFNTVNKPDDACLKSFNVSVSREFEKIDARILEPPTLYFYENQQVKPEDGQWNIERFQQATHRLYDNNSWTILNFSNLSVEILYSFSTMFIQQATILGLAVGMPRVPYTNLNTNADSKSIAVYLQKLKELRVQLVIVVMPDRLKKLYCTIKQVAELNIGILTQFVKSTTIKNNQYEETIRNILMKVNAKLQGVNYSFVSGISRPKYLSEPCIILGADVTHPKSKSAPSIAALVASHDPVTYFQYNVELRFQPPGVELMDDLEEMVKAQLLNFYERSGYIPTKIIYYRDGVGEGDFVHVMNKELLAIRRACISLNEVYQPPITFMIVQKRIHTRFFPVSDRDIGDWNYNVKVGTVVDTVVTHPTDIDFILVSHQSVKGMANPTKYRCLWDDSKMSEDELEQLTYYLCHMFARCSKSVKYPAPTYYAHLAAARARVLTQGMRIDLNDLRNEQVKLKVHNDLVLHSPMYFL